MAKRIFDIIMALIGLMIAAPAIIFIAIVVKCTSEGPIFYRGVRAGRFGKPFRIYKFRTMVINAEQCGGMSTAKDDPRITTIGKFLRSYKLDELPQLFNVLIGDMSFVGPRPEMVAYTDLYTDEEQLILSVRPGITDYASLEFIRLGDILGNDDPDRVYEEHIRPLKNALRVKYVREQHFWGDIMIILRTLYRVVRIDSHRPGYAFGTEAKHSSSHSPSRSLAQ